VKKLAAAAALAAAFAYLLISGNSVATQRAFIMLAVMTFALMLDRPAITMRNLALAALIILAVSPQMAVRAGFQMSFLAVMGLIAAYEAISWRRMQRPDIPGQTTGLAWRVLRWPALFIGSLALSTLIAGSMTNLPVAWHFNRLALYGLAGNLLALPLLTLIVMPAGLTGLALMPLGLEGPPLALMQWGLETILWWAGKVSAWPGAIIHVPLMRLDAALLISAGLVLAALRRDRWRLAGALLVVAGLTLPAARRPGILLEASGKAVAARDATGRLVPAPGRAGAYVLTRWLQRDGDPAGAKEARARKGWTCQGRLCRFKTKGGPLLYIQPAPWKRHEKEKKSSLDNTLRARIESECKKAAIAVSAIPLRGLCRRAALRIDRFDLWRNGAYAIYLDGRETRIVTNASAREGRPWAAAPIARRKVLRQEGGGKAQGKYGAK